MRRGARFRELRDPYTLFLNLLREIVKVRGHVFLGSPRFFFHHAQKTFFYTKKRHMVRGKQKGNMEKHLRGI
jgi:hypothetical protein